MRDGKKKELCLAAKKANKKKAKGQALGCEVANIKKEEKAETIFVRGYRVQASDMKLWWKR